MPNVCRLLSFLGLCFACYCSGQGIYHESHTAKLSIEHVLGDNRLPRKRSAACLSTLRPRQSVHPYTVCIASPQSNTYLRLTVCPVPVIAERPQRCVRSLFGQDPAHLSAGNPKTCRRQPVLGSRQVRKVTSFEVEHSPKL